MLPEPTISRLSPTETGDFTQLVELFEEVFELERLPRPPIEHYQKILADPNFIVVVARLNDRVIGGLTAYSLHGYHSTRPIAYGHDLAVHGRHQRQGVGRQLMEFFTKLCFGLGHDECFIQAELDDEDAIAFYRATPVSDELKALHFSFRRPDVSADTV